MRKTITVNLLSIIWGMWRRRYMIAIPILILPIIGLIIGAMAPKRYSTNTTILIQEAAKENPFLEDLAVETKLKERMPALSALLHSRHVLGPVAMKVGLISEETSEEDISRVLSDFSEKLRADLIGDDLVQLTYTSDDPNGMADTLHTVSLRFVERIIAPQRSSISNSENFLDAELASRRAELEISEQKLADYKTLHAAELPELHTNNVRRLQHLDELIAEKRSQLEGARGALKELEDRLISTNPVVGHLEEKIVEVRAILAMLRARYTDKHSKVKAALRHLSSLENERFETIRNAKPVKIEDLDRLWNMAATKKTSEEEVDDGQPLLVSQLEILQSSKNQVSGLTRELESLISERGVLAASVSSFGEHEKVLKDLQREIDGRKKIYDDLSERYEMARVTGALGKSEESERVKLIDPPFTPMVPSNLPLLLYVIGGLIGGAFLGFGIAFAFEVLDTAVYRQDVLMKLTGVPCITRVPRISLPGFDEDGSLDLNFSKTKLLVKRKFGYA